MGFKKTRKALVRLMGDEAVRVYEEVITTEAWEKWRNKVPVTYEAKVSMYGGALELIVKRIGKCPDVISAQGTWPVSKLLEDMTGHELDELEFLIKGAKGE